MLTLNDFIHFDLTVYIKNQMSYAKSDYLFVFSDSYLTRIDHYSLKITISRQDSKTVSLNDFGHFGLMVYLENQMSYSKSNYLFALSESFLTRIHHFSLRISICRQDSKTGSLNDFGHFGLTVYIEKQINYSKSNLITYLCLVSHF